MTTPPSSTPIKQGAVIGGWVCFALGLLIMYWSMWLFFIYGPLFFVAFVLAIAAMSQGRIVGGIALLLLTLTAPLLTWLVLGVTRTGAVVNKAGKFFEEENRKHGFVAPQIGPDGQFIPGHLVTPSDSSPPPAGLPRATPPPAPPRADDTALIEQSYRADVAGADATAIQIVASKTFEPCIYLTRETISFSPDAKAILYAAPGTQGNVRLIARSLVTGEVLRSFQSDASLGGVGSLGWSADGKRALVLTDRSTLSVVDFEAARQIDLPGNVPYRNAPILWRKENEALFVSRGEVHTLNLDSLTFSHQRLIPGRSSDEAIQAKALQLVAEPFPPAQTAISVGSVMEHGPFVMIKDVHPAGGRAVPYARMLLTDFVGNFLVSPDSHCLIMDYPQGLRVCYLGLRPTAARTHFWLNVDNSQLLTPEQRANWSTRIREKEPFVGSVYSSQLNPLNGKVIGPNRNDCKGQVTVSRWHDTYAEVETNVELTAFQPGDVVSNIHSVPENNTSIYFNYGSVWKPLEFGAHEGVESSPATEAAASERTGTSTEPSTQTEPPEPSATPSTPGTVRVPDGHLAAPSASGEAPVLITEEGQGYVVYNDPRTDDLNARRRVKAEYFYSHFHDYVTADHRRVTTGANDPPAPNLQPAQSPPLRHMSGGSISFAPTAPAGATIDSAERHLNTVYQQLRRRLSEEQKERLKHEEIRWIAQKESLPANDPRRVEVIERRIAELQNWH